MRGWSCLSTCKILQRGCWCSIRHHVPSPPSPHHVVCWSVSFSLPRHPLSISLPCHPPCEQWLTGEGRMLRVVPRLRGLGLSVMWHEWRGWELQPCGSPSHPRIPFLMGKRWAWVLLGTGGLVLHLSKLNPRK